MISVGTGAPTLASVLMLMLSGKNREWTLMMELYLNEQFNQRGWYINVNRLWLNGNASVGHVFCDPDFILEDIPKDGFTMSMRDAAKKPDLMPTLLLHNRRVGFRIPGISNTVEEACFTIMPMPHVRAITMEELCPWGIEHWILQDGTPLRMGAV